MNRLLLAALLLGSAPALPAGLASTPADTWDAQQPSLEGLYAALGGGVGLLFEPGDNAFGYDGEVRVGYSFNPKLQLYLSGAMDVASFSGNSIHAEQIAAFVQYHLLVRPGVMVYTRGGLGVGLSTDVFPGATAAGLAQAVGIGMEVRVTPNLFVAPEIFYRNTNLSARGADTRIQTVGLQFSVVYY